MQFPNKSLSTFLYHNIAWEEWNGWMDGDGREPIQQQHQQHHQQQQQTILHSIHNRI